MGFFKKLAERTERASMHAKFELAKANYERIMTDKGYWFENRRDSDHYSDPFSDTLLSQSRSILEALQGQLEAKQERGEWAKHLAGVCWQLASVCCVLSEYSRARTLLDRMEVNMKLVPEHQWEPLEEDHYTSDLLFLRGELLYLGGALVEAKQCFATCHSIDERIGDADGIRKTDRRLRLFS